MKNRVQIKNPKTNRWLKIDTFNGTILALKKSSGAYKGIKKVNLKRTNIDIEQLEEII